ncbi:Proteasome endopeptidase complex [Paragonimus heterotremus]|uniref:Proteasome endopeptidase complex n=1 Tax=Paragonimus heterotremus TaxID=100268 RepID=A0A8J4SQJ8_9TREM|nr:Proteasome endopeptidase complex [Paragonimus heterotremus]
MTVNCFQAYATSTQLYNWHFSPSDLANQRLDCNIAARKKLSAQFPKDDKTANGTGLQDTENLPGLDPDEELTIVKRYIFLMKALFDKFRDPRLPDEVYGFAVTYLKRFYISHSVMDFYPREMMLTCLYVACKAADFPIGIQTFISHIPRNQERYSDFILNSELFLLESLNYDLWVFTPYRPLIGLIIDLVAYQKRVRQKEIDSVAIEFGTGETELISELKCEGVDLINLWYQTDLCLTVHPSQFALAVLVELGRTRPRLDVEVFVRDEVCGCDPVQRPKKSPMLSGHESDEDDEKPSVNKYDGKVSASSSPEERWSQLSDRLDSIREVVSQFNFVVELERMSTEELKLENFRNPLYNIDSEEYAAAKSRADSLLANLE